MPRPFLPAFTRGVQTAAIAALLALSSACATTGGTFRSGVGDSFPLHPPYYAGKAVPKGLSIGYFPITFQRGATQPEKFDPKSTADTPLGMLIADMNRYLDSLGIAKPLAENATVPGTPPNVEFGCIRMRSPYDCDPLDDQQPAGRGDPRTL